jgi:DNA-binding transcriptional regulator YiaG
MAITGDYIKARRESLNLTQQDLANRMNVTTRTIIKWENGEPIPSHRAEKLEQILDGKGEESSPRGFVVYVPKSEFIKHGGRIIIEVI